MFDEKAANCMACDKKLFFLLLNNSSDVNIKYRSNCPYCKSFSFSLTEKTTYITPVDGLKIVDVEEISEVERLVTIQK